MGALDERIALPTLMSTCGGGSRQLMEVGWLGAIERILFLAYIICKSVVRQVMAQERGCEAHGLSGGLNEISRGLCCRHSAPRGKTRPKFPRGIFLVKMDLNAPRTRWGVFFRLVSILGR